MICSLRSTDETNDSSFGLGSNNGTSVTTVGNGSSAPTIVNFRRTMNPPPRSGAYWTCRMLRASAGLAISRPASRASRTIASISGPLLAALLPSGR